MGDQTGPVCMWRSFQSPVEVPVRGSLVGNHVEAYLCAWRSFQSPIEVPGVSNSDFLRLAANARRKQLGQEELGPLEFYGFVMPKVGCLSGAAGEGVNLMGKG